MSDRLTLAASAVRATASGQASGAACYTRSRVLCAVRQNRRRKIVKLAFGIPTAALFACSVAFAASPQRVTNFVRYVFVTLASSPTLPKAARTGVSPKQPRQPARKRLSNAGEPEGVPTPVQPVNGLPEAIAAPETSLELAREAAPPETPRAAKNPMKLPATARHATTHSVASVDEAFGEDEIRRYRRAHHAHFVEKNWEIALSAWDEYLNEVPNGRFTLEAQYNRALCLARLSRRDQALRALRPFANGAHGAYRQKDALELSRQLEQGAP